jgi:hypothetical protein
MYHGNGNHQMDDTEFVMVFGNHLHDVVLGVMILVKIGKQQQSKASIHSLVFHEQTFFNPSSFYLRTILGHKMCAHIPCHAHEIKLSSSSHTLPIIDPRAGDDDDDDRKFIPLSDIC